MSVVINTNYAASVASNNLAASSQSLQKSLNRLSSGSKIVDPSDDAGGLAVSMKLSAAIKRQGAATNNIGNSISFLQAQDGVMKVAGKVLERIGELKTLYSDPTKNSTDLANYDAEYSQLKAELTSLGAEKFNGVALFGSTALTVATTEDGASTVTSAGVNLLGNTAAPLFANFSDSFGNMANWSNQSAGIGTNASVSGGALVLAGGTGLSAAQTNLSFSGPVSLSFSFKFAANASNEGLDLYMGSSYLGSVDHLIDYPDTNTHTLQLILDAAGTSKIYIDGSGTAYNTVGGVGSASGPIKLIDSEAGGSGVQIQNFAISSTHTTGNTLSVSTASSLASLGLTTITSAIADVATSRASNGATQSRLGFASELLSVNKANLEAANSRIIDVDVAAESTTLARYNILTQAGTSMLSQANQSAQIALKLLG